MIAESDFGQMKQMAQPAEHEVREYLYQCLCYVPHLHVMNTLNGFHLIRSRYRHHHIQLPPPSAFRFFVPYSMYICHRDISHRPLRSSNTIIPPYYPATSHSNASTPRPHPRLSRNCSSSVGAFDQILPSCGHINSGNFQLPNLRSGPYPPRRLIHTV